MTYDSTWVNQADLNTGTVSAGTPTLDEHIGNKGYTDTLVAETSGAIIQSGITIASEWRFSTETSAVDPGNARFRLNNATQNLSTALYVDDVNRQGLDMGLLISRLNEGDIIFIQERDDSDRALLFEVSASASDNTGWWTIPIQNGEGTGTPLLNNANCAFIFQYSGAPIVHSGLDGLTSPADDHTQYAHTDSRRAFTNVTSASAIHFNNTATPAYDEGVVSWDSGDHTLKIFNDVSAMAIQVGQETVLPIRNETGSQIDDGTVLYLSGVTVSQGSPRLLVGLAKADDSLTLINPCVATHDIPASADGYATQYGFVRDIDTSGFIAGVPLFVSPVSAGQMVQSAPLSPYRQAIVGLPMNSDATSGALFVNPALIADKTQVIVYTLPIAGVTDTEVELTGSIRTVSSGETTTVTADWAVSNQHAFLLVNSITGSGTVTISGASLSESTAVPVQPDSETLTVATTGYYQTSKKWWEVTDIVIPAGISAINYDYGVVGYPDLGNRDFVILGYRCEAYAAGVSPDFRLRILKVQDDGSKKMSIVPVEDIGVDANAAVNHIVDHIRTGGDDRSFDPDVGSIWLNDTQLVFKQLDFNNYFSGNENRFESESKDEGYVIRIEGEGGGISNVDFIIIHLYFQIL